MFDFYQKRKLRGIFNSRYTQAVIALLVLFVGWSAFVRFDIAMEMLDRKEVAEHDAAELRERRDELKAEVEYLSTERGIEAGVRRQFDVALPGEEVVVILDEEEVESEIQPLATTSAPEQSRRWYQFWR